jgi:hypothetical protein
MTRKNRSALGLRSQVHAFAALVLALGFASPAAAAPIVTWDLANATGQEAVVLATALHVSATRIDEVGVNQWSSAGQDGFVASSGWGTSALSYDPSKYYEWTVSADPGYEIDYQTFDVSLFRGISGGGHGAQRWDLRASTDGFATSDLALGTFDISASGVDVQTTFAGHDISALGTQGGTVTFRLHGYDYTQPNDYSGLGNDSGWLIYGTGLDPMIGGTVAVSAGGPTSVLEPPPTLLACLGLAGLAVSGRRR